MITLEQLTTDCKQIAERYPDAVVVSEMVTGRPLGQIELRVAAEQIETVAQLMCDHGMVLDCITCIDWLADGECELVYDFFHFEAPVAAVVRLRVAREGGEVASIQAIYPGANWHEREAYDLFGIHFANHPNLTRILLPEDADFHPLRKDYQP